MRDNVRAFVELTAQCFQPQGPIFEFGSLQVEDSGAEINIREFFPNQRYIGCDMRPGPGVDRVEDLGGLTLSDGEAPTIICLDTLEHCFEARKAVDEMVRVLAPGGLLIVAVPMNFRVHNYPADYWRFTPGCIERLLSPLDATLTVWQGEDKHPHTVLGIGCKSPVAANFMEKANLLTENFQNWLNQQAQAVPLGQRARQWFKQLVASKGQRRAMADYYTARFMINASVNGAGAHPSVPAPKFAAKKTGSRIDLS